MVMGKDILACQKCNTGRDSGFTLSIMFCEGILSEGYRNLHEKGKRVVQGVLITTAACIMLFQTST
jgi:hypothetical protein